VGVHRSRGDARELAARAGRPAWWGKLLYSGMSGNRREKGAERADWEEGKMWEKGPERAEWEEEESVGAGETDVREAGEKTCGGKKVGGRGRKRMGCGPAGGHANPIPNV
jgi:hypothetical protein